MTALGPASLGLRMPAEWEPHAAVWIAWPHNVEDWPGKFEPIDWVYADFVTKVSQYEPVRILVPGPGNERRIRVMLEQAGAPIEQVSFFHVPTNRSWTRDFLPTFVRSGEGRTLMLDWRFNGWAKYRDHQLDDAATAKVSRHLDCNRIEPLHDGVPVVLEGGGIDVNGRGLLLTTEEWLLDDVQVRNPGFTREDYESVFRQYLGVGKTLWLRRGIAGDDTHGHIDDLARFTGPNKVLIAQEDDPLDENYEPLRENWGLLREMTDLEGQPLEIDTLPMPRPVVFSGQRLPASYANFYVGNRCVLVPTFNDPADRIALNTIAEHFPGRTVMGIHSLDLVLGLGTIHCMTQQQITA
jgi:agmatine deiminase